MYHVARYALAQRREMLVTDHSDPISPMCSATRVHVARHRLEEVFVHDLQRKNLEA